MWPNQYKCDVWLVLAFIAHIAGYDPLNGSRSFLININANDVKNNGTKFSKKIFEKIMIKNRVCLHFFHRNFFQPMTVLDSLGLVLSSQGAPLGFQKNLDLPEGHLQLKLHTVGNNTVLLHMLQGCLGPKLWGYSAPKIDKYFNIV